LRENSIVLLLVDPAAQNPAPLKVVHRSGGEQRQPHDRAGDPAFVTRPGAPGFYSTLRFFNLLNV
jgi:hypothetical protein